MASHDGASSSSSSSVSSFTHDVFLSFRDPDTGNSFTAFLHKHLVEEGVDVYMDREDVHARTEIKSALFNAIQGSKISIPVFSKGYADSRRCLDELVEILRCHRDNHQIIVPIFFDVDPRDVRHQTGIFKTSFDNHKDHFDERTRNSWKEALKEVAAISGYDLCQVTGNQSKLVDLVVERVLSESSGKRLADVKNPVGLNACVKEVEDRLCIGSDDVQFVGIWGMGGIGKTSIAKTLYNRNFKSFRRSCFLANIKGEEASGPMGLVHLQEQLIYSISKSKVYGNIENVHGGRQLIIEKLQGENVLLILDDVDSHSQLDAFAIESNWFDPTSKIVITSRDKHILELAKVDEDKIYCPEGLDDEQSLRLFSLHAFSTDQPPKEFLQPSLDVIHLAGGLPLTLEVLGSTFSDKDNREEEVWKSMLQELETIPSHDDVYKKLKTSYDNLEGHEKSIFLDAACCFVGCNKEVLISIWDACGFNPIPTIKKLTQRSLLKFITTSDNDIGTYDELRMHDQIQAMGRRIVYEKNPTEPSKRSRIWSHEEIFEAIEEPEGAQMLEVICTRGLFTQPVPQEGNFAMMSKLRVLYVVAMERKFPHLPPQLKWLNWQGLIVPANFYHKKLVHMDLSRSQIREAWTNKPQNENERFQKLKHLCLQDCDVSFESLDFSWFPYLETLDLGSCKNMVNLHKSIGDLKSLVDLNLSETEIEELPNSICNLNSLQVLDLNGCLSLKNLPESIGDLKSLVKLNLELTEIEEIPSSICKLSYLRDLILSWCSSLKNLPESIGDLKSLVKLDLEATKIEEIPSSIFKLSCLEVLNLKRCSSLKNLPDLIGDLKSLVKLDLERTKIEEIPNSIYKLSCLKVLNLKRCSSLKNLPDSIGDLKSLVKLDLEGTKIEEIPSSICKLSCLEYLNLSGCSSLKNLPESIWDLESLNELLVINCKTLTDTPKWKMHGQGTLLVNEMSREIDNYSLLNVNDGIDKGLILCVVFDLRDHVEERQLVDISLSIEVSIRRKHRLIHRDDEMVIEGFEYTGRKRDIIYVHHFKGFDWFGIPLKPGIDAIEDIQVFWNIESSKGNLMSNCKAKFWKVLLESTTSEQQQQITNQEEEESITTTARRMVADFFNWSDDEDHGRSHHFVPIQQEGRSTHKKIHHFTSSSNALEIEGSNKWAHDGASSSSSFGSTHDVFLSFRGEDTIFTGFLHSALKREGINVFIDSEGLWSGEEIQTALLDAIQQSKISIPIFSKGYADSKWRLMELVEINRCHGSNGQKVLPIFLDVEPRDVRHQKGSFEGSFQTHMKEYDAQRIQSWRDALNEVAGKKGYELKQVNGNQAELVKLIVDWALSELSSNRLSDVKYPVGLDTRVEDVLSRLKLDSNDPWFVGICGIGGMGKTTIATALYNQIFKKFDMSCFLANVREEASSGPNGVVSLQQKLIYNVSKKKEDICSVQRGKQLIKEKLQGKKVLLILDDVDSDSQLKDLATDSISFGPGSRIIITTRNKHILNVAKVDGDNIYQPEELDDEQSLQLFSWHAFSSEQPPKEYLQLSRDVIQFSGGLPLTLVVLGSTFSDKDNREEEVWKSMLQKLKRIPPNDVYNKLKISYDTLNDNEKSIFLDAACFFVGQKRKYVISCWDACGFNPILAIIKLTQRCLLKFETVDYYCKKKYDVLRMHDQIQAMGRNIVYKENPMEPSKRSRLWSLEELFEAIEEPEGVKMLEVIHMPLVCNQPFEYSRDFPKMSKLRLLHLGEPPSGDYLDFQNLPLNLRWLTWNDLIVRDNFYHKKLVHMDLSRSQIREAWSNKPLNENKRFQKLKVLILQDCDVSCKSLDFSWFPCLERLDLGSCRNMVNLHKSIGDLKSLVKLNFRFTGIEELPNSICSLSSLKVLYLGECYKLKNLPDSIGDLKSLVKLDLEATQIEEIPSSFYKLSCLKVLNLSRCLSLKNLPDSIGDLKSLVKLDLGWTKIEEIPSSIYKLSSLEVLNLEVCLSFKNFPDSIGDLKSPVKRDWEVTKIEEIPSSIYKLSCLKDLNFNRCRSLKNLPDSIGDLKSLVKLDLRRTNIEEIPSSIGKLSCLIDLNLTGCSSIKSLPYSIGDLKSLVNLDLKGTKIEEIPSSICKLSCLEYLNLSGCSSLKNLPESIWDLESLNELQVINCKTLTDTPKWKTHGQGTLLVDEMSRGIDNYSLLNVNDGIDKGLILCLVFDLQNGNITLQEGELVDISLSIDVSIRNRKHRRISCRNEVVIEGVEYTGRRRDIIYVHHFKGFNCFGIPLKPGIDAIEDMHVLWNIKSSKGNLMPFDCKPKFWKVLLESTTSEQQQQITNQEEEESITTTARRMVADFFNWSDDEDHGRSHHFVPTQQVGSSTHETIHHFTSSSNTMEIERSNPVIPQQADEESSNEMIDSQCDLELQLGLTVQGGGQAGRVAEDPNLSQQAWGLSPERLSRAAKRPRLDMDDAGPSGAL